MRLTFFAPAALSLPLFAVHPRLPRTARGAPADTAAVTIPAGAHILAQLVREIRTRSVRPGDSVYLVTTFPVSSGPRAAIPAGTYIVATVDTAAPAAVAPGQVGLGLRIASLIFPSGAVVAAPVAALAGARRGVGTHDDTANVRSVLLVSAAAPVAGLAVGALAAGGKGAEVGGGIGSVVGLAGAIVALATPRRAVLDPGLAVDLVLRAPLVLDSRVATTGRGAPAVPHIGAPARAPVGRRCWAPGTPGTPDVVIPGSPGQPPVGDSPGTPATPDIVIPGMPGTPGYWYSCR